MFCLKGMPEGRGSGAPAVWAGERDPAVVLWARLGQWEAAKRNSGRHRVTTAGTAHLWSVCVALLSSLPGRKACGCSYRLCAVPAKIFAFYTRTHKLSTRTHMQRIELVWFGFQRFLLLSPLLPHTSIPMDNRKQMKMSSAMSTPASIY